MVQTAALGKTTRPVLLPSNWFDLSPRMWHHHQHHLSCTKLVISCFFCLGDSTSKVTSANVRVSNHLCFLISHSPCRMSLLVLSVMFHPECNAAIHKKCLEKIIGKCTGTATNSRDTMVSKAFQCQGCDTPEISLLKMFNFCSCTSGFRIIIWQRLFLCFTRSFRRNASRLTCRIASRSTPTGAPPSVTTVAVCCGVSIDKALNVKVSLLPSF